MADENTKDSEDLLNSEMEGLSDADLLKLLDSGDSAKRLAARETAVQRGLTSRYNQKEFMVRSEDGERTGPFTIEQLRTAFKGGELNEKSLVLVEEAFGWLTLEEAFAVERWMDPPKAPEPETSVQDDPAPVQFEPFGGEESNEPAGQTLRPAIGFCRSCGLRFEEPMDFCSMCGVANPISVNLADGAPQSGNQPLSFTQIPSVPKRYDGIGRGAFILIAVFGCFISNVITFQARGDSPAACLFSLVLVGIAALRYQNMGMSPWHGLTLLIPIYSIYAIGQCVFCQEGYADADKLDDGGSTALKAIGIIIAISLGLIVLVAIASSR